jgi:hypothetical protein
MPHAIRADAAKALSLWMRGEFALPSLFVVEVINVSIISGCEHA